VELDFDGLALELSDVPELELLAEEALAVLAGAESPEDFVPSALPLLLSDLLSEGFSDLPSAFPSEPLTGAFFAPDFA
jgi:hypothetical protein